MLRHNVGRGAELNDIKLNLWTATIDLDEVLRIDFGDGAAYGCSPDELVGDDYGPTQSLADHVRATGASAMIVPSSALPGTNNVIIFGVRVLHPYLWKPVPPEEVPPVTSATRPVPPPRSPPTSVGSALRTRRSSSGNPPAPMTSSMIPPRLVGECRCSTRIPWAEPAIGADPNTSPCKTVHMGGPARLYRCGYG
jgi:hypothetical protein